MFAAEKSLIPDIFTSYDSVSVREQLKKYGFRFGTYLVSRSNTVPHINVEIVRNSIRAVLLVTLAEFCVLDESAEEITVLLMDNHSNHISSAVIGLLSEARVRIITFAPDTIQIFQTVGRAIFGILKQHPKY
jgi:hypothetical protein